MLVLEHRPCCTAHSPVGQQVVVVVVVVRGDVIWGQRKVLRGDATILVVVVVTSVMERLAHHLFVLEPAIGT